MTTIHRLSAEPQPIADQLMARCSCGWRSGVSFHDFPTRELAWGEVHRRQAAHLAFTIRPA
ncbi:MAG: hypothetical protein ACRYG4_04290 [Janthinobacterium lividum]